MSNQELTNDILQKIYKIKFDKKPNTSDKKKLSTPLDNLEFEINKESLLNYRKNNKRNEEFQLKKENGAGDERGHYSNVSLNTSNSEHKKCNSLYYYYALVKQIDSILKGNCELSQQRQLSRQSLLAPNYISEHTKRESRVNYLIDNKGNNELKTSIKDRIVSLRYSFI